MIAGLGLHESVVELEVGSHDNKVRTVEKVTCCKESGTATLPEPGINVHHEADDELLRIIRGLGSDRCCVGGGPASVLCRWQLKCIVSSCGQPLGVCQHGKGASVGESVTVCKPRVAHWWD